MKLIIQNPPFFLPLIGHSAVIPLVMSSLRPGKKDTDSPGFESPTSQSNTRCIRPQDHDAQPKMMSFSFCYFCSSSVTTKWGKSFLVRVRKYFLFAYCPAAFCFGDKFYEQELKYFQDQPSKDRYN